MIYSSPPTVSWTSVNAAASSGRTWIKRILSFCLWRASKTPLIPSPGRPKIVSTPQVSQRSISTTDASGMILSGGEHVGRLTAGGVLDIFFDAVARLRGCDQVIYDPFQGSSVLSLQPKPDHGEESCPGTGRLPNRRASSLQSGLRKPLASCELLHFSADCVRVIHRSAAWESGPPGPTCMAASGADRDSRSPWGLPS